MKLVLDTNIWVSAFLSKFSEASRLLSILKEKNISIVTSDYILVELERILLSSKIQKILKWEVHETHKYIVAIRDITEYILVSKPDNEILIRDSNDILILQTLIDSNRKINSEVQHQMC